MRGHQAAIIVLVMAICCIGGCSGATKTATGGGTRPAITVSPAVRVPGPSASSSPSLSPFTTEAACERTRVRDDINGDGRSDLITITSTSYSDSSLSNALVLDRTATGFDTHHGQKVLDAPSESVIALEGFLDTDCYADVALQVGAETVIVHGSPSGLGTDGEQILGNNAIPIAGYRLAGPYAIGDFNGDGRDDLVLLATKGTKSALCVMYGSARGLDPARSCLTFDRGMAGNTAVGDITGDHIDDLAVGMPSAIVGPGEFGEVQILYGSRTGLTVNDRQILIPTAPGVLGPPPRPDEFGGAVALGDVTGDGRDDLIVGAAALGNQQRGHATVSIYRGTSAGITLAGRQLFTVATPGMPGSGPRQGGFADSVAAGDFNGDGRADVAIGRPFLNVDGTFQAGEVDILYGTSRGLSVRGARSITPQQTGITVPRENGELQYGLGLSTLPSVGGHTDDLIIGVPHNLFAEEGTTNSWIVTVPGSRSGLDPARAQTISADQVGTDQIGAHFGR